MGPYKRPPFLRLLRYLFEGRRLLDEIDIDVVKLALIERDFAVDDLIGRVFILGLDLEFDIARPRGRELEFHSTSSTISTPFRS